MDTSNHTPGPWTQLAYGGAVDGDPERIEIRSTVCNIVVAEIECHHETVTDSSADARLIAAAPELLAALHLAQAILNKHAPHTVGDDHQIAAALAKAGA